MRPLRLRLSGLRSYLAEQEIDFSIVGLVAIVGDTGAGKSSLLEAICFALYGAATWNQRDVKDLISDRADTVRVQFDFLADHRPWRVTRATSTSSYPPPVHELRSLDDPTFRIDGASEVTRQIERLVGLDYQAFLRAVVLPQGRFHELLQASPTDRTKILKGIFRLDLLESMRDSTARLHRENRERIQKLDLEMAALLPNPAETLKQRSEEAARASETVARLEKTRELVQALLEQAGRWEAASARCTGGAAQLQGPLAANPSRRLREVVERWTPLRDRERVLEELRIVTTQKETELATGLARLEDTGLGARGLGAWEQSLFALRRNLQDSERTAEAIETREREVEALAAGLSKDTSDLQKWESELGRAEMRLRDRKESHQRVLERSRLARTRLQILREREVVLRTAQEDRRQLESQIGQLESERVGLQESAKHHEEAVAASRAALEALQQRHAAAHASKGCSAGDPCPVCERELPPGFRAPKVPAESAARAVLEQSETGFRSSTGALARLQTTLVHTTTQRDHRARILATAHESAERALAELQELLPNLKGDAISIASDSRTVDEPGPSNHLDAVVASIFVPGSDLEEAEALVVSTREHRDLANQAMIRSQSLLQSARLAQSEARAAAALLQQECNQTWADLARALQLPAKSRAKNSVHLNAPSVDHAEAALANARRALEALQHEERAVRTRLEEIRKEEVENRERQEKEVAQPLQTLQRELTVLHERIIQAVDLRESLSAIREPEPITPERSRQPGELVKWAAEVEACARALHLALESEATRAAHRAETARRDAWQRLAEENFTGGWAVTSGAAAPLPPDHESLTRSLLERLNEALQEATFTDRSARNEMEVARSQLPRWTTLREALARSRPTVDTLAELTRLLSDGKFVGYVVQRQQRGLLAIASELLRQTSGGRFGFAETFEVVDLITGQVRKIKTLSGGETFLASLALALGLVELAGRRGGRLDALFLHEGFGSLDTTCLAETLETLGRQARAGRLVAVITHLHAVAESIDDVLMVTRDAAGSHARWLRGEEREALVMEDARKGLLV